MSPRNHRGPGEQAVNKREWPGRTLLQSARGWRAGLRDQEEAAEHPQEEDGGWRRCWRRVGGLEGGEEARGKGWNFGFPGYQEDSRKELGAGQVSDSLLWLELRKY